jgi:glycine cleavage system H protein
VEKRVSEIPSELLYTEEHEYVKRTDEADVVLVGITDYAQGELGDVVYVELPKVGDAFGRSDVFGTLEAVKAVSELFSPLAGEVEAINTRLDKEPGLVNSDPYGEGWMLRLRVKNSAEMDQLLGPDEYRAHVGE